MDYTYMKEYERWCIQAVHDEDIMEELGKLKNDKDNIEDAFYRNLAFGTGGLRGVIGAGTNRMNIYTVAKASQGLADYVNNNSGGDKGIVIAFDSRIKSDVFAKTAAFVFASNEIRTYIYREIMPTPCLSYAVRYLGCSAGIVITASHNPSIYNGYKIYGPDGCQITDDMAEGILSAIEKLDIFNDIAIWNNCDIYKCFEGAVNDKLVEYVPENVYDSYIREVKSQSVQYGDEIDKGVSIIYSPLNGTGLKPIIRVLEDMGYNSITLVKEQEKPDGNFPTCPYPNPELGEAMELGIEYAYRYDADLFVATDPDCDRAGIAVKDETGIYGNKGEYVMLSGNETGILLLDYICSQKIKHGTMPDNPVFIKTIVTTDMAKEIARHYGVVTIDVLTGFKYIGEQIGYMDNNENQSYVFGFEESCGYLSGSYVRDKDAVDGTYLICEMYAYYKTRGISLVSKLMELYETYGWRYNRLHSYEFKGVEGMHTMKGIMTKFRKGMDYIGKRKIINCLDYSCGIDNLPVSDVLKYELEDRCSVVIRPSGTEPKLKVYISVCGNSMTEAEAEERELADAIAYLLR